MVVRVIALKHIWRGLGVIGVGIYYYNQKLESWLSSVTDFYSTMTSFNEIAGNALLFFLVFGMSATVDIHMLLLQLKNIKALLMGIFLQFAILPMLGFLVVKFGGLERSAGISLLVVTSSPGGSYSNW